MRGRFWKKAFAFCIPFLVVLGPAVAILGRSGELVTVDEAIERQRNGPLLYGQAYSYPVKPYKLRTTAARDPQVLALGSSRVMQLRDDFFREPNRFYNAGGAGASVWDLRRFLALSAPKQVKVLLLGLDQWYFNPRWAEGGDAGEGPFLGDDPMFNIIQRRWLTVYRDLARGKIQLHRLVSPPHDRVGLSALSDGSGFRANGSYRYGDVLDHPDSPELWDSGFHDTLARIAAGNRRFEWSTEIWPQAVEEVGRLLDDCAAKGVRVIGFLPPFAPTVAKRMAGDGDHYRYVQKILPALRAQFAARGYAVYDFTYTAPLDADREFIDGFHGSERTYLRLLLALAASEPQLAAEIDRPELERRLAQAGRFEAAARSPAKQAGRGSQQ